MGRGAYGPWPPGRDYYLIDRGATYERVDLIPKEHSIDIVDQLKKGYTTSEFWIGLVAIIGPPIAVFSGYEFDVEGATTLITSVFGAITYIASRTWLKRKRIDAVIAKSPAA